ncbi:hypothetical protein HanRHA438_Chr17g0792241 [Helianthus annuus]|uniref:Uncharacterized protein n=1 Tax=Helianthus annuus TaxID=4232 RepID=A0A9K3DDS3_HELAN|nr:hypothetical protein HanXRQr2_Chr17g0781661 [Helianthus annuus]KAJ0431476.1 hypothetical protein HanIR_Chr17g0848771 [Helianthus annuus]KAJ0811366.1 hypothetical protein HanPSC8_Chr17g0749921 [Helianthus annuus]KAJ0824422.1 hypothetical protein HanRHA438_Chr17g0792241 [Helianthus annuus]
MCKCKTLVAMWFPSHFLCLPQRLSPPMNHLLLENLPLLNLGSTSTRRCSGVGGRSYG